MHALICTFFILSFHFHWCTVVHGGGLHKDTSYKCKMYFEHVPCIPQPLLKSATSFVYLVSFTSTFMSYTHAWLHASTQNLGNTHERNMRYLSRWDWVGLSNFIISSCIYLPANKMTSSLYKLRASTVGIGSFPLPTASPPRLVPELIYCEEHCNRVWWTNVSVACGPLGKVSGDRCPLGPLGKVSGVSVMWKPSRWLP